jgi:two-component system, NtrC family, response regulator HydG
MTGPAEHVLLVDDDPDVRESLAEALAGEGHEVRVAEDAADALRSVAASPPAVVLSDVRMPGDDGIALLRQLRRGWPETDVVMMTAYDDMQTVATAMREGAMDFLVKPVELAQLRTVLQRVIDDRRARLRQRSGTVATPRLESLVGSHPLMIEVYKRIGQAAAARANVLIRGESGTGKELIARAIHTNAPNATEPFVAVNCAAVPGTLLESELFGHARGAFTGAVSQRRGCFAVAGRGTIFLDEIGDTSADFQSKLLRVLQSREYQPVGSEQILRTEARVIAATHRPLEQLVAGGRFRADLYYRLRVLEISVPPLRERITDVPRLAEHLAARASEALGVPAPVLSRDAAAALLRHDWPGNVRELENCVVRATAMASGKVIRPEHLGLTSVSAEPQPVTSSLADVEREHIARVLAFTGGNKARAVEILGISKPRLNRLLHKHGIE